MIYTNGRILIDRYNNAEELARAVRLLKRHLQDERAVEADFLLDDTVSYPCYLVPEGVTWIDMDQALRPNIMLRAINQDMIILPDKVEVTMPYYFDEADLAELATKMSAKTLEKLRLEKRKSTVMKEFNAQISALEEEVNEIAEKHQAGHEDRDYLCLQKLNFADGVKYFVDANQPTTIRKTEPLEGPDFQLRWDATKEVPVYPESPEAPAPEPMTGSPLFDGEGTPPPFTEAGAFEEGPDFALVGDSEASPQATEPADDEGPGRFAGNDNII